MYSPTVEDHFQRPRNGGRPARHNAKGISGDPSAGPFMVLYLFVRHGRIEDAGFQTFGCGAAIAAGSVLTEMVKDRLVSEVDRLSAADLIDRLGGLPLGKRHCADIAVAALRKALEEARIRPEDASSSGGPNESAMAP
jgi:nitrogen fixation NifU-like protein